MDRQQRLRIAVQKSGRLTDESLDLLHRCGVRPQLLYLDGSHAPSDVAADLAAWWPLLAPGGILFGDDFASPGVSQAAMEFAAAKPAGFLGLAIREGNFWIMRKRESAA